MHKFLVCTYKSQDFAQSQTIFARSHDRETVTFRNSEPNQTMCSAGQSLGNNFTKNHILCVKHEEKIL